MATKKDMLTGQEKEMSEEELQDVMDQMRSGEGSGFIKQTVKRSDGTEKEMVIWGGYECDGYDRTLNIFMNNTDLGPFVKIMTDDSVDVEGIEDPCKKDVGYQITVDFLDHPMTSIMRKGEGKITQELFIRDEKKSFRSIIDVGTGEFDINENGEFELNNDSLQENKFMVYVLAFLGARRYLLKEGIVQKLYDMYDESAGVVLKVSKAGKISAKVVKGMERPDLPCNVFLFGEQMCRPYIDEMIGLKASGKRPKYDPKVAKMLGGDQGDPKKKSKKELAAEKANRTLANRKKNQSDSNASELSDEQKKTNREQFFKGKLFVISGFDSFTEKPIMKIIEENGGIIKSSTVLDTDYLIYEERFGVGTKKHERAIELNETKGKNIKIIPLKQFNKMVEDGDFSEYVQDKVAAKKERPKKKDAGEEPKPKKDTPKKISDKECSEYIRQAKKDFQKLNDEWQDAFDDHSREMSTQVFMSPTSVKMAMNRIIRDRDRHGRGFDRLISEIDKQGKEFIDKGCSAKVVAEIRNLISDIIDDNNLSVDFGTTGTAELDLGSTNYEFSAESTSIRRWWKNKYDNMPEIKAEKERKRLENDLKTAEKELDDKKSKRNELDSDEQKLNQEILTIETKINELEQGFESSKNRINGSTSSRINEIQRDIEKIRVEKESAEKSIDDMQAQIAGLSIFKFALKKELTKKVEETRASIPSFTERIRKNELELDEVKKKGDDEIASLQRQIEDLKKTLSDKHVDLSNIPIKKAELDKIIEDTKASVCAIKEKLANS